MLILLGLRFLFSAMAAETRTPAPATVMAANTPLSTVVSFFIAASSLWLSATAGLFRCSLVCTFVHLVLNLERIRLYLAHFNPFDNEKKMTSHWSL